MKISAVDIGKLASASDVIFDVLRSAITDGSLAEGEILRQDRLAKMFNTSRIPVREALARLEEQGLVTTQRYRGAVVATLSTEEIEEIYDLRALIEAEVVRRAVPSMSQESLKLAGTYCDAFGKATDPSKWGGLNRLFHFTLYRDCGRPYFLQIIDNALNRIERYQRMQLLLTDGMKRADLEHRQILEACKAGNAEQAAELTRSHILGASGSLVRFLNAQRRNADAKAAHHRIADGLASDERRSSREAS